VAEMGQIQGRMSGSVVVRGEDVERVLSRVPEGKWFFDIPIEDNGSLVDIPVEIPMRVRREIIAYVLAIAG
jgi:phenylacetate-coenzyme A ligase PaaK-like adenylate-forming protein